MATPPALPAPGGNASAALALANATLPEEMVIHSGTATTEGDMSYLEEEFDPCRQDPRRNMPGVLDSNIDISQLNTINFNNIDQRTAQVAVVQQGVDPALASQLMAAQQQALQSEANARHTEVMERQRDALVSEARDQLASIEQQAADEISKKNLLLNEQAAQAMSEQKSNQLHVQAQDHRIKELTAELNYVVNSAGAITSSAEKSNADLQTARSELAEYRTQIDAMNQYTLDMKRMAESQKKDFEAEIEKLRKEQKELIRNLKSQPLEGTPGLMIHYGPGKPNPGASQPSRPIIEELASGSKKPKHSSDADDEQFMADPMKPPGLPGGGPPGDDDDDDDFDDKRSHKDKKDKKKKDRKTSRGRSRQRRRRDPSTSPSSSSSPTASSSDSESSFARKVKRALERSRTTDSKAKESDRILVPKFPQPENYRNWRIRVRDAVIAASAKPDLAFEWVEEVLKTDQSVEALKDSGKFVTLDAKLMSSLTNICEGDFARQLDIFKEEQAKSGTPARGRQALLMIHKHFSTSRKHGAVYDIEDLMAVTLVNDDLRGFITRWDAVIAGMTSEPDMMWKQAYFHNAIKNFKPLSHDLAVYDRTPEGEPNRSYDFLMKAARDYLERKRLEKMRQATKKSVSGKRDATPVPTRPSSTGKGTGICYDFQAGKCTRGKDCRYKHEKVDKGKGGGKKGKPRSKSRGTSRSLSPGSRNQVCKFWKAGKCQRGNDCAFQHPPKPAAASTKDDKRGKSQKKKKKNKKKGDRSRSSSRGSNSSRGSQSLKDKGGKPSSSGSAAVCLMRALMMVAVVNPSTSTHRVPEGIASPQFFNQHFAMPVTPNRTVSFGGNDEIFEVPIDQDCNLHPCQAKHRTFNPVRITKDDRTRKDTIEARESDAILAAQMLQSAVFRELHGKLCKCSFECDSDIGCRHCIRSDLNALPGHMPSQQRNASAEIAWIADTGSAQDLVCSKMIPDDVVYHSPEPLELITANGSQSADQQASVHIDCIDKEVHPYVLPDTPAVISVGMRCIQDGWDFVWKSFSRPYFKKKDGTKIKLEVKDFVPYLPSRDGQVPAAVGIPFSWNSAAGNGKPIISPVRRSRMSAVGTESEDEVEEVEEPYEASIADDDEVPGQAIDDLEEFFPGELAPGPPAAMTPDVVEGSEDEGEAPEEAVDGRLQLPEPKAVDRGEAALREEARTLRHMMTHTPKNPFCETCKCAKMYKPTKRSKGESLTVESNKFGDHITGDHPVTRDSNEQSIDGDRVAMVMKDVATNFRWIYPSARSHAKDCVLAFRHFIAPGEEVGVFYSDAAPSIKLACREVGWRQNTSVAYVSKSNAVAERNLRSVLEGTRVNLEQAGLHHSYWSYAARHWCMAHNIQDHPEILSPWELRFGEKFKGPNIPFGARIDYWTGPKLKPKKDLRFDPTSNPGVFLGYAMQPGFVWRNEFLVASLKDLMEKEFNESVQVVRVNQLTVPDGPFVYPLKGRYKAIREGLYESLSLDAPPDPKKMDAQTIEDLVVPRKAVEPGPVEGEEEFEQLMREAGLESDDIEVIDPKTGKSEFISKDDPSYYDASGFKGRRYKGSSKPKDIPTFLWRGASKAARERAKREALLKEAAEKHDAAVAKERKYNRVIDRFATSAVKESKNVEPSDDFIPAMPVTCNPGGSHGGNHCHRDKLKDQSELMCFHFPNALVARPVGQKEINNTPAAQAALDKEWNNLTSKGAWDYSTVREWDDVSREAIKNKTKVHVGKIFEICVEKGSELPQGDPMRKFKGRTVFQGNNVKDEAADVALFAELGSSPANMEAGKALDAYGSMPGNRTSQGDGKQAYTQALMQGILTWIRLPRNRWPKEWIGVYKDPVVLLILALYGHPDSGGLWQRHCEKALYAVGFHPLYPECWPSMFWHPKLKLLLGVYVDDFKMSGPSKNIDEGWKLISSQIDMDTPEDAGRYLGCEHVFKQNVKLDVSAHPFAHVFDASIPDPSSKPASPARRTKDYWEHMPEFGVYVHHHLQPRKKFQDKPKDDMSFRAGTHRLTVCEPCQTQDEPKEYVHDMESQNPTGLPFWWTGSTYFVDKSIKEPSKVLAAAKKIRDKSGAKKAARAQGFTFLDELEQQKSKCMTKNVNTVEYDMRQFLQQCIDRYVELAGPNVKFKKVSTPFPDDKIAHPIMDEAEARGELQPIASRVLMKVLFAARMARFDLLRATQGLASRVTKWSPDCDKSLHRLMCYIHTTLDRTMVGFVGDSPEACKTWLFADSDHAGEHDNRSTSGCLLALVGPNTFYPLTAFSKKQTSTAMSSTEAEVTAANLALRAVGLPSSCLWSVIRHAGGDSTQQRPSRRVETRAKNPKSTKDDYWEHVPFTNQVTRVHVKPRNKLYNLIDSDCPVNLQGLARQRYSIMKTKTGDVEFDLTWDWTTPDADVVNDFEWTGKTIFRIPGPNEVDYGVESREIRSALSDFKYIGSEKRGDESVYMAGPGSLEVIFLEDNQATIRILESGRSPSFRHTDKTQRLNLSWLSEQFKRKHFKLVYVGSSLQAADILTKPFTNSEKWESALRLMGISSQPLPRKEQQKMKACAGEPAPSTVPGSQQRAGEPACPSVASQSRVLIEFCCGPDSKLGDRSRKHSKDCYVIRCTEERDVTSRSNRMDIRNEVIRAIESSTAQPCPVLIWISILALVAQHGHM